MHPIAKAEGPYAYIPNFNDGTVSVIDTHNDSTITTIPVGSGAFGVAVGSNGKVYVTNQVDNSVSVIDSSTNTVTGTIILDKETTVIAINPSGTRVYAAYNRYRPHSSLGYRPPAPEAANLTLQVVH